MGRLFLPSFIMIEWKLWIFLVKAYFWGSADLMATPGRVVEGVAFSPSSISKQNELCSAMFRYIWLVCTIMYFLESFWNINMRRNIFHDCMNNYIYRYVAVSNTKLHKSIYHRKNDMSKFWVMAKSLEI